MKIPRTKLLSAVALTLFLTMAIFSATAQPVKAVGETPDNPIVSTWNTYLFCMLSPNPTGVGQTVIVSVQLDKTSPTATSFSRGDFFGGMTVTITKPDNKTETKTLPTTWATSGTFIYYTPTMAGTYTFEAHFPGQWVNGSYTGFGFYAGAWSNGTGPRTYERRWFTPSDALPVTLTVQEEQVQPIPENPLPQGYWTTPVNGENKGWYKVQDNWLMPSYDHPGRAFTAGNAFSPYTSAPESAHVLWKEPLVIGGMSGGPRQDASYYTGLSYEQFYTPIIIQGQIIYTDHGPSGTFAYGTRCLDLYTGKQLWYLENVTFAFAQVLEIDTPNEHGAIPYLWQTSGSTWTMYDAFSANTGQPPRKVVAVANVTTGTYRFGPNGEILSYSIVQGPASNRADARLILWNSTRAIYRPGSIDTWSPTFGSTPLDGRVGIEWNVSMPQPVFNTTTSISDINYDEGYMLCTYTDNARYPRVMVDSGYTLPKQDTSGIYPTTIQQLWVQNRSDIEATTLFTTFIVDGFYARFQGSLLTLYGYDMKTGNQLWKTGPITSNGWAYFSYLCANAYGKTYLSGYDGHVRAFNNADGSLSWDYYFGSSGYENAYGTWPTYNGFSIADGKIFLSADEHSPDSVLWRGGKTYAIDAATGANVWNMTGWLRNSAISNGYLTAHNALDGQAYVVGKGPSETTVAAPMSAVVQGQAVTITGTVMDQSPGSPDTPAISDVNQPEWMAYLHAQKPKPTNVQGVPVTVVIVDPNGNVKTLDVTSNIYGGFGISWTPELTGLHQVIANFAGTNSYGDSSASTYITVGSPAAAPTATPTPPPATPTPPVETATPTPTQTVAPVPGTDYTTLTYVAVAAVITIVVIAVVAMALRRRK